MKKRALFIFLTLIMLGTIAYFYVNNIFLPAKFRQIVLNKSQEVLHRRIHFSTIRYSLIKGFILKDFIIYEKDDKTKPFVQIDETSFNILILPILKEKNIVIPTLRMRGIYGNLIREKEDVWNFSDLLKPKDESSSKSPYNIFIKKIALNDGSIDFKDSTDKDGFTESLRNLQFEANLNLDQTLKFKSEGRIPNKRTTFKAKGTYEHTKRSISSEIYITNLHLAKYLSLFIPQQHKNNTGIISLADIKLEYSADSSHIQGDLYVKDFSYHLKNEKSFSGDLKASNFSLSKSENIWAGDGQVSLSTTRIHLGPKKMINGSFNGQLSKIIIKNSEIILEGNIESKNASMSWGDKQSYKGYFKLVDSRYHRTGTQSLLNGNIILNNANLVLNDLVLKSNISLNNASISVKPNNIVIDCSALFKDFSLVNQDRYRAKGYIEASALNLNLIDGNLSLVSSLKYLDADVQLQPNIHLSGEASTNNIKLDVINGALTLSSLMQLKNLNVQIGKNITFIDDPTINITASLPEEKESRFDYNADISLNNASVTGVTRVEKIDHLKGKINVKPNTLTSEQIAFSSLGINGSLSGSITNFADPHLNVSLSTEKVAISKVVSIAPNILNFKKFGINVQGQTTIDGVFDGLLSLPREAEVKVLANLTDTTVSGKKLKDPFESIQGKIQYVQDSVSWSDLNAKFKGKKYTLNGKLSNFSRPVINTTLRTESLQLRTQIKLLRKAFQISSMTGQYFNSKFDVKGDVRFFDDSDADIDIRGFVKLNTKDLGPMLPKWKDKIESYRFGGFISGDFLYQGKWNDWRNWKFTFDAESPLLKVKEYTFQNAIFGYAQRDQYISQLDAKGEIYDGSMSLNSRIDIKDNQYLTRADLLIDRIDLVHFRKKVPKNPHLAGLLTLSTHIKGPLFKKFALTGTGDVEVKDGYLGQIIKEFDASHFTAAKGTFIIKNGMIETDDIKFRSDQIDVVADGWIDSHLKYDMHLLPIYNKLRIKQAERLNIDPAQFIKKIVNIHCKGKIGIHNKCSTQASPVNILKETTNIITDTLKGAAGIFDF